MDDMAAEIVYEELTEFEFDDFSVLYSPANEVWFIEDLDGQITILEDPAEGLEFDDSDLGAYSLTEEEFQVFKDTVANQRK